MAEYYLVSQLPSLDGIDENSTPPITEERFLELCERFLGKKAKNEIEALTIAPSKVPTETTSELIGNWNTGERELRLALAKVRAEKMKKTFDTENIPLNSELLKVAKTAVEFESPLEAEKFLSRHRLSFLETLRPMDTFSQDFVYYYGLKLKLIHRMNRFDTNIGKGAYKNIYDTVLNGDRLEAM